MAQIISNNSDVTNGSVTVQFNSSPDLSAVPIGSVFIRTGDAVSYLVAAVDNALKTATLNAPYAGVTGASVPSVIHTAFTAVDGIPYPEKNDIETSSIVKLALLKIQQLLTSVPSAALNNFSATTDPGVGDDNIAGYSIGSRWVRSNTSETWTATSVATGAAVWDQEDNDSGTGITDHTALTNIGTNTHAQIDTHIADATLHRIINDAGTLATELFSAAKIISDLAGKANSAHTHTESDITDLQSYLLNITGEALTSLANVSAASPVDGEVLTFDLGSGLWINAAPTGGGGGSTIQDNFTATAPPAVSDDGTLGYEIGSRWKLGTVIWIATDVTTGAAVWLNITNVGSFTTTVVSQMSVNANAAEERNPYSIDKTSSDLEIGNNPLESRPQQTVAIRFPMAIDVGDTIDSAYIQFRVDEISTGAITLKIDAELVPDSPALRDFKGNITIRPRTVASTTWTPADWNSVGDQGATQQTSDLATIIQELIDQSGWVSGFYVTIIIAWQSGTGYRTADSKDSTTAGAPELNVNYNSGSLLQIKAQNGDDDVEQPADGQINSNKNLVSISTAFTINDHPEQRAGGFIMTGINIDQGKTINEAYLQFSSAGATYEEPTALNIWAEAVDSPAAFDENNLFDVSGRTKTSFSVPWKIEPWLQTDEFTELQRTPDLSTIVQEIVNRVGWSSGNSILFIFIGTGERRVNTPSGAPSGKEPTLTIRYSDFVEPTTDHAALKNAGVLTHSMIDDHIGDGNTHSEGFASREVVTRPLAEGEKSVAVGHEAIAHGKDSIAIGRTSKVVKHDSGAIGAHAYSHSELEFSIGHIAPVDGRDGRTSLVGQYGETDGAGTPLLLGVSDFTTWAADFVGVEFEDNTVQTWRIDLIIFNKSNNETGYFTYQVLSKRGPSKGFLAVSAFNTISTAGEGTIVADTLIEMITLTATGRIAIQVTDGSNGVLRVVARCAITQVRGLQGFALAGWNLSTAAYTGVFKSVTSESSTPIAVRFSPDGLKMFILDSIADTIYQYTLTVAGESSSATYDSVSFNVNPQNANPKDFLFDPTGLIMFMVGSSGSSSNINQYTLTSPFNLATMTADGVSFVMTTQDARASGIDVKPDGSALYMIGTNSDQIHEYALATNWSLAVVTFTVSSTSLNPQDNSPQKIAFKTDGTRVMMLGNNSNSIFEYDLTTAWLLSSIAYNSISFSVAGQETGLGGMHIKSNGQRFYIIGSSTDTMYDYTMT